jgi:hypothetical protein
MVVEGLVSRRVVVAGSCYSASGINLGGFKTGVLSAGWHRITAPEAIHTRFSAGMAPMVVRVTLPDGNELTRVIVKM